MSRARRRKVSWRARSPNWATAPELWRRGAIASQSRSEGESEGEGAAVAVAVAAAAAGAAPAFGLVCAERHVTRVARMESSSERGMLLSTPLARADVLTVRGTSYWEKARWQGLKIIIEFPIAMAQVDLMRLGDDLEHFRM